MWDTSKGFYVSRAFVTAVTVFITWVANLNLSSRKVQFWWKRRLHERGLSVSLPTHTIYDAPLSFKEKPLPGSWTCSQWVQWGDGGHCWEGLGAAAWCHAGVAGAAGRACLLLADNIANGLRGRMRGTLGVRLHLCSCLNINYNASAADLGLGEERVMCLKILHISTWNFI